MFFRNMSKKIQFNYNLTRGTGAEREGIYTFMINRWILLRMRKGLVKICRESKRTFYVPITFFENRAVYESMWKNKVEPDRPQMTI
jgi:hypothetical protein